MPVYEISCFFFSARDHFQNSFILHSNILLGYNICMLHENTIYVPEVYTQNRGGTRISGEGVQVYKGGSFS